MFLLLIVTWILKRIPHGNFEGGTVNNPKSSRGTLFVLTNIYFKSGAMALSAAIHTSTWTCLTPVNGCPQKYPFSIQVSSGPGSVFPEQILKLGVLYCLNLVEVVLKSSTFEINVQINVQSHARPS
jgi:hypothetical protein